MHGSIAGTNPHDMYQLSLALDDKDPLRQPKQEALAARGLGQRVVFPLRMGGLPNSVLQYAAFVEAQPEDAGEVDQLAQYLLDRVRIWWWWLSRSSLTRCCISAQREHAAETGQPAVCSLRQLDCVQHLPTAATLKCGHEALRWT